MGHLKAQQMAEAKARQSTEKEDREKPVQAENDLEEDPWKEDI